MSLALTVVLGNRHRLVQRIGLIMRKKNRMHALLLDIVSILTMGACGFCVKSTLFQYMDIRLVARAAWTGGIWMPARSHVHDVAAAPLSKADFLGSGFEGRGNGKSNLKSSSKK